MYPKVSCPSRLFYFIYTGREAQCNTTNNYTQSILPTWYQIRFRSLKSSAAFVHAAPREIDLDSKGGAPLVRRLILFIQPPFRRVKPSADRSSPSYHHRQWPPTQLHSHCHRRPCRRHVLILLPPPDPFRNPNVTGVNATLFRSCPSFLSNKTEHMFPLSK
jgi:hypothetical protein